MKDTVKSGKKKVHVMPTKVQILNLQIYCSRNCSILQSRSIRILEAIKVSPIFFGLFCILQTRIHGPTLAKNAHENGFSAISRLYIIMCLLKNQDSKHQQSNMGMCNDYNRIYQDEIVARNNQSTEQVTVTNPIIHLLEGIIEIL